MKLPLLGGDTREYSRHISNTLTQNLYPHVAEDGLSLYPFPGSSLWRTTSSNNIVRQFAVYRAFVNAAPSLSFQNYLFSIEGSSVIAYDAAGTVRDSGSIESTSGPVYLLPGQATAANNALLIIDGKNAPALPGMYYINCQGSAPFVPSATDADFPINASVGDVLDGYFIVNANTELQPNRFYVSDLKNCTSWSALSFAEKVSDFTKIQQIKRLGNKIFIFGEDTTEIWVNIRNPDFPFQKQDPATMSYGIAAPDSAVVIDNIMYWITKSRTTSPKIVKSSGGMVDSISTPGVDRFLETNIISDAKAWPVFFSGHRWYLVTFPSGSRTYVYDVDLKMWFTIKHLNYDKYNVGAYIYFEGKHLVADSESNRILMLDENVYTNNGQIIERVRRTQFINIDNLILHYKFVELEFEVGVGNATAADPKVFLRWSDDGGNSWSGPISRSLGAQGKYKTIVRVQGRLLGASRNRQFEISVTDPVKCVLKRAFADVSVEVSKLDQKKTED